MSAPAAPRIFISYAHDTAEHYQRVGTFASFLRARIGLDVRLDQWDDSARIDWSDWAIRNILAADFVLVIASPDYKRRANGEAPAHEGRGSQFEARIMRDALTRDLHGETRRILPVVLPGGTVEDIPSFLTPYCTTHYRVPEFTDDGVAGLISAITGRSQNERPVRGTWRGATDSAPGPALATELPWREKSADITAGPARIDGISYEHSVVFRTAGPTSGAWAFAEIDLGGSYAHFTAVAGVLDDAEDAAFQTGLFCVRLDGEIRHLDHSAFGSPRHTELDVTGVRRLRLEIRRPAAGVAPAGPTARTTRPAALAWGNPTLR
ncbi:SEFIR domain-containing protein [Amycolatopsis dendrobii]|uniref:TIR domain-containing protein n=1 Tax=Amycolatopsis dendrobii TaxID=2760662 RepID=A0A7W3VXB7_9PSEU|nr:SEFIR domain-containing protein [Amycolatopsis dendrobii]MBB1154850.1 TIR domain-containing protein [Amycolatopsis dendrobii]